MGKVAEVIPPEVTQWNILLKYSVKRKSKPILLHVSDTVSTCRSRVLEVKCYCTVIRSISYA